MKACVLLIAIRPSDGDLNLAVPLVLFDNSRLLPVLISTFTHPHLTIITDTLLHSTDSTYSYTHLLIFIDTHQTVMWPAEVVQKKKWATLSPLFAVKRGSNFLSVWRVDIRNTHTHTHTTWNQIQWKLVKIYNFEYIVNVIEWIVTHY